MATVRKMKLVPMDYTESNNTCKNTITNHMTGGSILKNNVREEKETAVQQVYEGLRKDITDILENENNLSPDVLAKLLGLAIKRFYIYRTKSLATEPLVVTMFDEKLKNEGVQLQSVMKKEVKVGNLLGDWDPSSDPALVLPPSTVTTTVFTPSKQNPQENNSDNSKIDSAFINKFVDKSITVVNRSRVKRLLNEIISRDSSFCLNNKDMKSQGKIITEGKSSSLLQNVFDKSRGASTLKFKTYLRKIGIYPENFVGYGFGKKSTKNLDYRVVKWISL
jgi:hypothetical protein